MEMDEKSVEFWKSIFPNLRKLTTKQAFWQTLASGNSVLISDNGNIKEVFPDGTSRIVDKNEPPIKMKKGRIIKIK